MPRTALAFAFFLSGAAGLIFQVVWFYRSGLVFGNSTWAVALVLSSFMCGLALGGALAGRYASGSVKRLLMTYAALEITIGLSGVVVATLLPNLTAILVPLLRGAGEQPPLANAIRLCVAFVVLVVPATAMGATLPVLVGALSRKLQRSSEDDSAVFGRALGRLYGWNTLGAMAGVVVAETLLIDRIGVTGAALTAAGLCACAAATAISVSRSMSPGDAPAPSRSATRRKQAVAFQVRRWPLLLVCAFITGGSLLALEVIWFRFLTMYVLSTTLAMRLMLAQVLAAIGAGSLTAAALLRRRPAAPAYLP
jgi:predicted membrane-bound spermidine synthase